MLTLKTNKLNIFGRILGIILLVVLQYLFIKEGILDRQSSQNSATILLYVLAGLVTVAILQFALSFFSVLQVQVDESSGEITLKQIFSTSTIQKDEIAGYYTTTYHGSRAKDWVGLQLKMKNGQTFKLIEQNLLLIQSLQQYFELENVVCLGEKRRVFMP